VHKHQCALAAGAVPMRVTEGGRRCKQQGRGPSRQKIAGRRVAEIPRRGQGTDKGAGSASAARSGARIPRKSHCILKMPAMETDARSRILCALAPWLRRSCQHSVDGRI
jgi:hypothetical protein